MSIGKIGVSNMMANIAPDVTAAQTAMKRQEETAQETYLGDVVSIGKSETTNDATKLNYPPLFPLGDTQGIFRMEE